MPTKAELAKKMQETTKVETKVEVPLTLEQLKTNAKSALIANNDTEFNAILGKIAVLQAAEAKSKLEAERAKAKAEAEALKKEAEALAKVREETELAIFKAIKALKLDKQIADMKATGFTYRINRLDTSVEPNVTITETKVTLLTPQIKLPKVSGGGNGTASRGKSKDEFGMSLGEIFDKFATEADKVKLSAATSNSAQWQVKVSVKKSAIAAGLLKPVA